jgi:hypothetical protein
MARVQLVLAADDPDLKTITEALGKESIIRAKPDHFERDINIINLLINLTTTGIPIVALLIAQHIKAKRFIKLKYKGIEIQGESLEKIEALLTTIFRSGSLPGDEAQAHLGSSMSHLRRQSTKATKAGKAAPKKK